MTEAARPEPHKASPLAEAEDGLLKEVRARTPARILTGRNGPAYTTTTWLQLRQDHAAARDAVQAEIDLERDLGSDLIARWGLFEIETQAATKEQYLLRPDLGRRLMPAARNVLQQRCPRGRDVQIAIGDGLSAAAVQTQVPTLLPQFMAEVQRQGLTAGQPFFIRHCRVGVLNEIGELLSPEVVVLLIGERPGLATAESLSAYLAYRPAPGHTDAQRNLISNIHARGVPVEVAAARIMALGKKLLRLRQSGVAVKEDGPALPGQGAALPDLA